MSGTPNRSIFLSMIARSTHRRNEYARRGRRCGSPQPLPHRGGGEPPPPTPPPTGGGAATETMSFGRLLCPERQPLPHRGGGEPCSLLPRAGAGQGEKRGRGSTGSPHGGRENGHRDAEKALAPPPDASASDGSAGRLPARDCVCYNATGVLRLCILDESALFLNNSHKTTIMADNAFHPQHAEEIP